MKPIIYAALSALLALGTAACSADDPVADITDGDGGSVTFSVDCSDIETLSRGIEVTLDDLTAAKSKKCLKAFAHKTSNGEVFIDQLPLFHYENEWHLRNTLEKFYARDNKLAFYAWGLYGMSLEDYAKNTKGVTCNINSTVAALFKSAQYSEATRTLSLSEFEQDHKVDNHVDLLVGGDKAPVLNPATKELNVNLNMQHALAQVKFRAYVPNRVLLIEIAGIRLTNVYKKGNITLKAANFQTGSNQKLDLTKIWSYGTYTDTNEDSYYIRFHDNTKNTDYISIDGFHNLTAYNGIVSLTPQSGGNMIVVPFDYSTKNSWAGTNTKTGARISVLCRVYTMDRGEGAKRETTLIYPSKDDGKFAFASLPLNVNLKPGVCNLITLKFSGAGKIDPDQTCPEETRHEISETPNPNKYGGSTVLNGDIKFNVEYQEWIDGGKSVLGGMDY